MNYILFKRIIDIFLSCIALVVLFPLFLIISILIILIDNSLKIFYVSERIGQYQKPFKMFKFRTMKRDCLEFEVFLKTNDDPRITKIGRFLRKTSLDEIPQFLNVLKGDMSIVGNRPIPLREAEIMAKIAPERFNCPAGITGLWQVNKEVANTFEKRVAVDKYYSKVYNIKLDYNIILITFQKMFKNF